MDIVPNKSLSLSLSCRGKRLKACLFLFLFFFCRGKRLKACLAAIASRDDRIAQLEVAVAREQDISRQLARESRLSHTERSEYIDRILTKSLVMCACVCVCCSRSSSSGSSDSNTPSNN